MDRGQILSALESSNYTIEHDCACDCEVDGITSDNGVEISGNECWQSNSLYIDGILIAEYIQHNSRKMHIDDISDDDISDDIWGEMAIGDDADNPVHDEEQMILEYLQSSMDDWRYYRDNERNFANEYTIILISPDIESVDGKNIAELSDDWDTLTAEETAHEIAYTGDAATQAYNSLRVID